MSGYDLRHIRAANAVAEELSFSRAAVKLHLTQPALTKQIQELEAFLGVILFVRNAQRVELTDACRTFIEEIRVALLHLDRALHMTRTVAKGAESVLHLGTSPYIEPFLVSSLLAIRLSLFPALHIHVSSHFSAELSRQVLTGQLDVAILTAGLPDPKLNRLEIASAPLYAAFLHADPLAQFPSVDMSNIDGKVWVLFGRHVHPTLYDEFMMSAQKLGVRPSDLHHVTTAEEAAHFIVQSRAVAFLTKLGAWRVATGVITMRPFEHPNIRLRTVIVTRAEDRSRLTSEFVRAAVGRIERQSKPHQRSLPLAS